MNWYAVAIIAIIIYGAITITLYLIPYYAHGQDIDPRYYCLYADQYPFSELCNKQKINELYNQLDQKVKEWNINHTALEFKMTPQLNNETRLLQVCIIYKINDTRCNLIYGDITN